MKKKNENEDLEVLEIVWDYNKRCYIDDKAILMDPEEETEIGVGTFLGDFLRSFGLKIREEASKIKKMSKVIDAEWEPVKTAESI